MKTAQRNHNEYDNEEEQTILSSDSFVSSPYVKGALAFAGLVGVLYLSGGLFRVISWTLKGWNDMRGTWKNGKTD